MGESHKFAEYEYNEAPNKDNCTEKQEDMTYGFGVRHIQLIILILCLVVSFIARGHMGVTIVAMTNHDNASTEINATEHIQAKNEANVIEKNVTQNRPQTYDWPKFIQEIVLNSFFAGYTIMMFPIGIICQKWGGKVPLQVALFINAIVSILTPWLTIWGGWKALSFCRFLQGLSQAGTFPSSQALLAKWVPMSERATLSSYVYTGPSFGTIIAFQLGGILGASRYGWLSTFWTVGALCLISFIILTVFATESPLEHRTISQAEKNFITGRISHKSKRRPKMPWKAIIRSRPVWGTIATHVGCNVTYLFLFIQVPSYIHNILHINVKNSGVLSSLPYIASSIASLSLGYISDYCTNNKIVSIKNARRISNTFSQCGVALALICVSYTSNTSVAVACLVSAMIFQVAMHTGWMVNHMDLAPNYTGLLMATGNTLANIMNIFLTTLTSFVITDMTNVLQWRIMFFITACICVVTNAIFVLLISSEVQPWNDAEYKDKEETNVEEVDMIKVKK